METITRNLEFINKKNKKNGASRCKNHGGYEREMWSVFERKGGKMEG